MNKKIELIENSIGGLDLIVEKDAGNPVRILTGNQSLEFWQALQILSEDAIDQIGWNKQHGIYKGN